MKWSEMYDYFTDALIANYDNHNPFTYPVLFVFNWVSVFWWRVFIRGHCAVVGCIEKHWRGYNMPDDADEWGCDRCGAEGINWMVQTRELFYGDDKLHDFILALKGK